MNNYLKIPDDFVLNLPPEQKDEFGYTPSQNKEIEKQMVKDTSKSKGAWARFMKAQEEAERAAKPKLENLPILNRNINDRKPTGARTALSRGGSVAKVAPKKDKMLQYIDDHLIVYENKKATPTETEAAIKRIDAKERAVANRHSTEKKKEPTSPVKIDFSLNPMRTAFLGTRGLGDKIKNTSLYKLLDNPRAIGVELGHESIVEIINLLNQSGLLKDGGRVK